MFEKLSFRLRNRDSTVY